MNQTFQATGLTCQHCVNAVREEVGALPGVGSVAVELAPAAASTIVVEADRTLARDEIAAALDEAGDYALI